MAQPGRSEPHAQADVGPRPGADERVPLGALLAYALPVVGFSATLFFVQFFFLKFATDVLLVAPATVGVIFALGRAWDAVSDPVVGTWSDRTRTRLGRRRPWMLAGVPLLAASFAMLWLPPEALEGAAEVAWLFVALFGFYTAFTIYGVPHQSLGAELTRDHHERSRIFGLHFACFTGGMMLAFVAMGYVNNAEVPRAAAGQIVAIVVVAVSLVLLVPPLLLRERADHQGRGGERPLAAMADVLKNVHARRLLAAQFVQMTGTGVIGILSPYQLEYIVRRPDLIAPLPAVFVICSVLSIPFWIRASRRFGKRRVWLVGMVSSGISFGLTFFVGENDWELISVLLVLAGASLGCGGTVGPSILADVIDSDELNSGQRKEGAYSAAWGFAIKSANALVILATGVMLQVADFRPNVEQTEGVKLVLRLLYGVFPLLMFLAGASIFRGFALDEAEHARIRDELDRRRSG